MRNTSSKSTQPACSSQRHSAGGQHAEDRLRPVHAADEVIDGHDHGGRDQHPPVAIERQEHERGEHVEVRLDAAAGEMNQQARHQHLRRRDHEPRMRAAGLRQGQPHRQQRDEAAEIDGHRDVQVRLTRRPRPRARRNPVGGGNAGQPLHHHQPGKEAVGVLVDAAGVFLIELFGERHGETLLSSDAAGANSPHPNTNVDERSARSCLTSRSIAVRPALSPS